jgi:phospholipase D1/2
VTTPSEDPPLEAPREPRGATTPEPSSPLRTGLLLAGLAVALVAAWRLTPLATLLDRRHLAELGRAVASSPAAPALVIAVYVAAGLVLFPVTPLLAATALAFEPWHALGLGLAGALSSAAVGYAVGRLVARRRPRWIEGPRFAPFRARLQRRGVLTMAVSRLVPVGNFTLANVAAGAIGIPFGDYLLGNGLGLLPGLIALTLLSHGLRHLGWLT